MKFFGLLIIAVVILAYPYQALALYKPYLKIEADRQAYQEKVSKYSPENQKKLTDLNNQIEEINKRRIGELSLQMQAQADILDEYQRRHPENTKQIEDARYWLTYAHEAVAFQLIQVYIFNLSSEKNIKNDAGATVNKFESDLSSTRNKVIKSLNIVKALVKNEH